MEDYASYEDSLSVQFMARILQLLYDKKDHYTANKVALYEYSNKFKKEVHTTHNEYVFIDGSKATYFGNNRWECNDLDFNNN